MKVDKCKIVGAMTAPRGNAPFDRANLVVETSADPRQLAQVNAYLGAEEVDVLPLRADDWQALVKTEQAIELPPMRFASGATLWVLRTGFGGGDAALEELKTSGALVDAPVRLGDGSFGCVVCERGQEASKLRDQWALAALNEAKNWAADNHWERARVSTTRAFVIERAMNPETVAMLTLTHEKCGNATRAAGYLKMAERTYGADFVAQIHEKRADIERRLHEVLPISETRPRFARAIHEANARGLAQGRERLKGKRWKPAA